MYVDGYSAWITVPDHELREFDVAVDHYNRRSTCWIPSIEGMNFCVHWKDHGWKIPTATFIKLDGYTVPGHFLMGSGEAERSDIRVGITTVRPFEFQRVPEAYIGAMPADTDPTELGTIIVKIKRVSIVGKHAKNDPIVPRPPVGGKLSIGAEDPVGIGYGVETMGPAQMPATWKVKPWDRSKPGTYATFIFRYRTRKFLISQGIMSDSDEIYTSIHARRDSPFFPEAEDDLQDDDESVPPSPTEPSPPSTPALSVISSLSSPRRAPSVRPPSRPVSNRSVSLGEPPRPTSALTQASRTSKSPAPLPHPIVMSNAPRQPPKPQESTPGPQPDPGARRVVSYDATTTRAITARSPSHLESVPTTTPPAHTQGSARNTTTYKTGAVSYYDLSTAGSQDNVASPYDFGVTETYDFSTLGASNFGAAGHFEISSADDFNVNAASAHGGDPNEFQYDADANVYLSYPYAPTDSYNSANNSYDSSADNSYDLSVAGPYDPSSIIHSYDPNTMNITSYYGQASTAYNRQEQIAPGERYGPGSILARAAEAVKDMPSGFEGPPIETAPPPRPPTEKRPHSETRPDPAMYLSHGTDSILARAAEAVKDMPSGFEGSPVETAPSPRPPKEKRPYSKTRPGPAMYLGQGPYKELAPKTGSSQHSSQATEGSRSVSVSSSRSSGAGSPQGPVTMTHAMAKAQSDAQKAQVDVARAETARQMAARGCTPAVPIPKHLVFVDADGGELPPPPQNPIIPTARKTSGSHPRH